MKKIILIAAAAITVASCQKKEDTYKQDSNTMLAEPEYSQSDSATQQGAGMQRDSSVTAKMNGTANTNASGDQQPADTKPATDHAGGNTNAANSTGQSGGRPNGTQFPGSPAQQTGK